MDLIPTSEVIRNSTVVYDEILSEDISDSKDEFPFVIAINKDMLFYLLCSSKVRSNCDSNS